MNKQNIDYKEKYDYLIKHNVFEFEAREIASNYDMVQINSLAYIQSLLKSHTPRIKNITEFYDKQNCLNIDGNPDVWKLLRKYRGEAIENGGYDIPRRKHGIRHIDKDSIDRQRQRHKARQIKNDYEKR